MMCKFIGWWIDQNKDSLSLTWVLKLPNGPCKYRSSILGKKGPKRKKRPVANKCFPSSVIPRSIYHNAMGYLQVHLCLCFKTRVLRKILYMKMIFIYMKTNL